MEDPDRLQAAVVEARALLHELGGSPRFRAVARGLSGIVPGNFFASVDGSIDDRPAGSAPRSPPAWPTGTRQRAVDAYAEMMTAHGRQVLAELRRRGVIDADHRDRRTQPTDQETP